jgi:short-subunit dehydrogenase
MDFNSKIIMITGATGGLGKEMVKSFSQEGAKLILSDINHDSLEMLKSTYNNSVLGTVEADLTKEEGCKVLVDTILSQYGVPDILINNAGIATLGKFCDTPEEKWESVISLNILAPMRITYPILKKMRDRKSGYIVNISSVAGLIAVPGLVAYSTSKFAIKAFGEALYHEYKDYGIFVSNLYPFFTDTPILQSEQFGFKEKKAIPEFLLSTPKDVIKDLLIGMKKNELHIYPGVVSQSIDLITRIFPGLMESFSGKQIAQ